MFYTLKNRVLMFNLLTISSSVLSAAAIDHAQECIEFFDRSICFLEEIHCLKNDTKQLDNLIADLEEAIFPLNQFTGKSCNRSSQMSQAVGETIPGAVSKSERKTSERVDNLSESDKEISDGVDIPFKLEVKNLSRTNYMFETKSEATSKAHSRPKHESEATSTTNNKSELESLIYKKVYEIIEKYLDLCAKNLKYLNQLSKPANSNKSDGISDFMKQDVSTLHNNLTGFNICKNFICKYRHDPEKLCINTLRSELIHPLVNLNTTKKYMNMFDPEADFYTPDFREKLCRYLYSHDKMFEFHIDQSSNPLYFPFLEKRVLLLFLECQLRHKLRSDTQTNSYIKATQIIVESFQCFFKNFLSFCKLKNCHEAQRLFDDLNLRKKKGSNNEFYFEKSLLGEFYSFYSKEMMCNYLKKYVDDKVLCNKKEQRQMFQKNSIGDVVSAEKPSVFEYISDFVECFIKNYPNLTKFITTKFCQFFRTNELLINRQKDEMMKFIKFELLKPRIYPGEDPKNGRNFMKYLRKHIAERENCYYNLYIDLITTFADQIDELKPVS